MDPLHLHDYVIVPALDRVELQSLAASRLVLGTAIVESQCKWVRQIRDARGSPGGPALGLFQMEPQTHDDIWDNWLRFRKDLAHKVVMLAGRWPPGPTAMVGNLFYAAVMCRLLYRRRPEPLPAPGDPKKMAGYHKRYYNTFLGATREAESVKFFEEAIDLTGGPDHGY